MTWTEWITRPDASPTGEWTLVCAHGSVTSEQVKQTVPPQDALDLFVAVRDQGALDIDAVPKVVIRMLLGILLAQVAGCDCGERPFALVEERGGEQSRWWFEDVRA